MFRADHDPKVDKNSGKNGDRRDALNRRAQCQTLLLAITPKRKIALGLMLRAPNTFHHNPIREADFLVVVAMCSDTAYVTAQESDLEPVLVLNQDAAARHNAQGTVRNHNVSLDRMGPHTKHAPAIAFLFPRFQELTLLKPMILTQEPAPGRSQPGRDGTMLRRPIKPGNEARSPEGHQDDPKDDFHGGSCCGLNLHTYLQ